MTDVYTTDVAAPFETRLLIDGEFRDGAEGATFPTWNPATGRELAQVALASRADVDAAVAAARGAFEGAWAKTSPARRARMLNRLAQLLDERTDELATLESRNNGKPRWQAAAEIKTAVATLELFAGAALHLYGRSHVVNPSILTYTLREPVGVCGAIIPWNYPLMMAVWKVAPALAAGNTLVLKPASATPLTALALGQLALEAGIPAGVLNVVTGPGSSVGEALASHPDVDKIAFTGETTTGRRIAAVAADTLKRVSLELGGKSPNIVFADADLDAAVVGSLWAVYYSAGQSCEARTRLLVQDGVYDRFAATFTEKAAGLKVGDPLAEDTKVGSLISRAHAARVLSFVEGALDEGAELLTGGAVDGELGEGLDAAAFVRPTVIGEVRNDMHIAQEEVFGPVVTLQRFTDEADAVKWANDVRYGLAATVWTGDTARGHRVAQRVRSGAVGINTPFVAFPGIPFGGFKESGYGREQSLEALDLYTETKAVLVGTSPRPVNPLGV
ncbi:MAG TPA: aldehyde dehydrogenase family protein [candidate division Zixibacteria bacterium]|nr:aldehyde dehydrogenase family protein [candidate division Zixibacteria bacterium]